MAKSMMMAMMEMTMETMVLVAACSPSPLPRLLVLHSVCPPLLGLSQLVEFSRWHCVVFFIIKESRSILYDGQVRTSSVWSQV